MDLIKIDETLLDVIKNPENYEIEICATSYDLLKDMAKQIRELQKGVEIRIMSEMIEDEATKLKFVSIDGTSKVATLSDGPMKAVDNSFEVIRESGFDPDKFGNFEYKLLSWSKLKETRKLGGAVKDLIDKLYVRGRKTIKLESK